MGALMARLVVLSLAMSTVVLVLSGFQPAAAGSGDVLTIEWSTKSGTGTFVSQSANVAPYPATHAATGSGAVVTATGTTKKITVAPPTGQLFVAGTTYDATPSRTDTTARLDFTFVYSSTACPQSTLASTTASITVHEAAYDADGALTQLAADYQATCLATNGDEETVAGSVRYLSAWPWLALQKSYTPDTVPFGYERTRPVTITAVGTTRTVQLGAASLTGYRAQDYSVSANGCAGVVLANGDSCQIDVSFAPIDNWPSGPVLRKATLHVAASGYVSSDIRVLLNSTATVIPGPAQYLSTYPTANGVGVTWSSGSPTADHYRLERRLDGESTWTALADLANSSDYNYVDTTPAPGQAVDYRVIGHNADWDGPAVTTSTTRPLTVPTPTTNKSLSFGSSDVALTHESIVDGIDGGAVSAQGASIRATGAQPSPATAAPSVTYAVPAVPGPGEYRSADGLAGRMYNASDGRFNCTYVDAVLDVRSVLYDDTRTPVVFDGSWAGRCTDGTVTRMEVRLGVDTPENWLTSDPTVVGRLVTFGGAGADGSVTLTNHGPEDVTLGAASLRGVAAGDWSVTNSTCNGATLTTDATCTVDVHFSSTADNDRSAVLEVAQQDADGGLAPAVVPLDGWGATPPAKPSGLTSSAIGALLLHSIGSPDDGGLPIDSYDVERRVHNTSTWTSLGSVPATPGMTYVDRDVVDGTRYEYRVRAVNPVGPGPWGDFLSRWETSNRAWIVSGSVDGSGLRGLYELSTDSGAAPVIPLTSDPLHDYRDPAASPAGTKVAVSVSVNDGSDGEYDLWVGTLGQPATTQLTSMAGGERDARFSPDASTIAFTHVAGDGTTSVWLVPAAGGDPVLVRDSAAAPAWSPDGADLIVEDTSGAGLPLLRIHLADDTTTPIAGTDGATDPAVSRGGSLAYVATSGSVYELAPGASGAKVKLSQFGRRFADTVYDDLGAVFASVYWADTGEPDHDLTYRLQVSGEPAPILQDREPPVIDQVDLAPYVHGSAVFSVSVSDHGETPVPALIAQCRLDAGDWTPCGPSTSYADLSEGKHVVHVKVTDEAGHTTTDQFSFVSDTVAPRLAMKAPRLGAVLSGLGTWSWDGVDATSGVGFYDIKIRVATPSFGFSNYHLPRGWSTEVQRNDATQRIKEGEELCLRGRVRDLSGIWSNYAERCVARPVDDAHLDASAGWAHPSSPADYLDTESVTSTKGATLRTGFVTTRHIGVLATTCATCGSVKVFIGKHYVGTVDLTSTKLHHKRLLMLPRLAQETTGRVTLRTVSGRTVRIDGLLLRRT